MDDKDSLFRLRWDNQGSLLGSVANLFHEEAFVDTTIFTEGKLFKAHRLLLSASSPYLKHVLQSVPGEHHSVLLLPHVNSRDFEHVLKFIYEGEIKISQKDLKSFLHVARILKIKGMDFDDEETDDLIDDRSYNKRDHSKPLNEHSRPSSTLPNDVSSQEGSDTKTHSSRNEKQFLEQSHSDERNDYDDKEITFLSGEDDDDQGENSIQHNDVSDDNPENDTLGLPILPEVSMEVEGSLDEKHPNSHNMQITRSWSIPHSSTSVNHGGRGSYGQKTISKKFGNSSGDGILMRMMKEPLKSSMIKSETHFQYDLDETGQKRAKRYVQCSSCSKVLSSLSALKRHMEDVHCARIQGKCLICGRVYSSRNSLLTHVYSAHKKHHDYKAVARIIRESDFETFATS